MLKLEQLSKTFIVHILGAKRLEAFRDVSFHVEAGKLLAISGPSGSGKSSVLKCIYRTYLTSSGSILYASRQGIVDLARLPEHGMIALRSEEIAFVSQFLRVLPRVTALDIVAEALDGLGTPRQEGRRQARDVLRRLHIPDYLHDAYPSTFSGGEQQRVNIARAVIRRPKLLLLDEPTASLDRASEARVRELLGELKKEGTAMVGIFHDPLTMKDLADDIYYMKAAATHASE